MKPIPISCAADIARDFHVDQVIIVARKIGEAEHVTTFGVDEQHRLVAARIGDFLKFQLASPEFAVLEAATAMAYDGMSDAAWHKLCCAVEAMEEFQKGDFP